MRGHANASALLTGPHVHASFGYGNKLVDDGIHLVLVNALGKVRSVITKVCRLGSHFTDHAV